MNIEYFFALYKNSPRFLKNEEIDLKMDRFKNFMSRNITKRDIKTFSDIMVKDRYFTFIKNPESLKTVLLLAELFTENSI